MQVSLSFKSITHRYFLRFFSGLSWKGFHYRKSSYPNSYLWHLCLGFFQFLVIFAKNSSFLDHCIELLKSQDYKDSSLEKWDTVNGEWVYLSQTVSAKKIIRYYKNGVLKREIKI